MNPLEHLRSAQLSPMQLRCLSAHCFDGFSHREIAERLGLDRRTVGEHIRRAREKLSTVGLKAQRMVRESDPIVETVPSETLDALGPADIKATW